MINPISGRSIKENGSVYHDLKKIGYIDIGTLVPGHYNFAYQKKRYDTYALMLFLPSELICIIFEYCTLDIILNLRRCCTAFYEISMLQHKNLVPALKHYFYSKKDVKYIIRYINAHHMYINYDLVRYALRQLNTKEGFQYELLKSVMDIKVGSCIRELINDIFLDFIAERLSKSIEEIRKLYGYTTRFGFILCKELTIRNIRNERYWNAKRHLEDNIYCYSIPQLELLCKDNGLGSKIKINKNNSRAAAKELLELLI